MIMIAGVMMNFITAIILLFFIGLFNTVSLNNVYIDESSIEGINSDDRIVAINGNFVNNYDKLALEMTIVGNEDFTMTLKNSDGEKYDVWQRLYNNEIKILAGARSAVFAPLQNIGLIIIDEEHEGAYKQTNPAPRYDARVVAKRLAQFYQAPLLLGSATPDVNSYAVSNSTLGMDYGSSQYSRGWILGISMKF